MDKPDVYIRITGIQGSGKTHLFEILRNALEKEGYSSTKLYPIPNHEDRLLAWNSFHYVHIDTALESKEEEVTNA